jgi:hypothetical protein
LFCFVLFCFVLFCFVLFCFVLFCFVLLCFTFFDARSREIGTGQRRLGGINSDSTPHDGDSSKAKLREDTQHQALRSDGGAWLIWVCLFICLFVYLFICFEGLLAGLSL